MEAAQPIRSVGAFMDAVHRWRQWWHPSESAEELWFRGERREYKTLLRPQLYRPAKGRSMKPVPELLDKENNLYEDFQRCADQLSGESLPGGDGWDWDSYFLMQHHNAPTRLLDWSDGALMALHFAVRNKGEDDTENPIAYVLDPYRLADRLEALPETEITKQNWTTYLSKNPSEKASDDVSGAKRICRMTRKAAPIFRYPAYPWCWISITSRGASRLSAAGSFFSAPIKIG